MRAPVDRLERPPAWCTFRPVRARVVRVLACGLAFFACVGCDRLREVKRCRALAKEVNTSLDKIETQSKAGKTREGYGVIAFEYDSIAHGLDGFDAGLPDLDRAVAEYAALARTSARQSAALAEALGAHNAASATLATHELERLARQEKIIVARIDEECRTK